MPHRWGLAGDSLLGLLLGADEEHGPTLGHELRDPSGGTLQMHHGLLEIKDVDAVPLCEDVALHLGIPSAGLVAEMHTRLQERLHGDGIARSLLRSFRRRGPDGGLFYNGGLLHKVSLILHCAM